MILIDCSRQTIVSDEWIALFAWDSFCDNDINLKMLDLSTLLPFEFI